MIVIVIIIIVIITALGAIFVTSVDIHLKYKDTEH